jgi:hypothetical protein
VRNSPPVGAELPVWKQSDRSQGLPVITAEPALARPGYFGCTRRVRRQTVEARRRGWVEGIRAVRAAFGVVCVEGRSRRVHACGRIREALCQSPLSCCFQRVTVESAAETARIFPLTLQLSRHGTELNVSELCAGRSCTDSHLRSRSVQIRTVLS